MIIERLPDTFWKDQPFMVSSNIFYKDEFFEAHTHSYYEFFMIVEGEMDHIMNSQSHRLQRRSLCFLYPDDEHELHNSQKTEKVHIINCTCSENFFLDTVRMLQYDVEKIPDSFSGPVINIPSVFWRTMVDKANLIQFQRGDFPPHVLRAMFRTLLLDVLLISSTHISSVHADIPVWLVRAREKMQYEENFIAGLERFIELSGRTQEHLTRCMSKYYDETPTAYINQLRVKKAAGMLLTSRKDVWEIMYDCGFSGHSYFLKCFRKSFGMSPRQYIKINQRAFNIR